MFRYMSNKIKEQSKLLYLLIQIALQTKKPASTIKRRKGKHALSKYLRKL